MILILSPAKTYHSDFKHLKVTEEVPFVAKTQTLLNVMKQYDKEAMMTLMKISDALAETTVARYKNFEAQPTVSALYAFDGEAYKGLAAHSLSEAAIEFAKDRLIILSGLYGMLTPQTIMKPYRLEMGLKLPVEDKKTLVNFWKPTLTGEIEKRLDAHDHEKVLLNLASKEYSQALDLKSLNKQYRIVTVEFKEQKGDTFKVVGMYAKKARGHLARYILEHQIDNVDDLKTYMDAGYCLNESLSTDELFVYTRQKAE